MPEPHISDEEFEKFREYFYRKTGIQFEASKRYFVDKRLVERIDATGSETFRNYFTMLRFQASGEELQQLVNLMTVNETYFFREEYQFTCLVIPYCRRSYARKKRWQPDPDLVDPLVVRRGGLLDRDAPAGIVGRHQRLGYRDHLVGHRHADPRPRETGLVFGALRPADARAFSAKYFKPVGDSIRSTTTCAGGRIHPRQPVRTGRHAGLSRFRRGVLPQPADLLRRPVAQDKAAETFYDALQSRRLHPAWAIRSR
jgi:hypothetical protein